VIDGRSRRRLLGHLARAALLVPFLEACARRPTRPVVSPIPSAPRVEPPARARPETACVRGEHPVFGGRSIKPLRVHQPSLRTAWLPPGVRTAGEGDVADLRALLAGMMDVAGVAYEGSTREIVLFGPSTEGRRSPLNADDWVVAFQSIYAGEDPAVSIDPGPDPSIMQVRYFGPVENTHLGHVMFEADRLLKVLSSGFDNLTCARVQLSTPSFKTKLALLSENLAGARHDVWERLWFVPRKMVVQEGAKEHRARFLDVPVEIRREVVGGIGPSESIESASRQFVAFLNDHYDRLAGEQPILGELRHVAKFVAIARWFADRSLMIDEPWVGYHVPGVATPTTTPANTAVWRAPIGSSIVTLGVYGGVDLSSPNNYSPEPGVVDPLIDALLMARPSAATRSWDFRHATGRYRAGAVRYRNPVPMRRLSATRSGIGGPDRIPIVPILWTPAGARGGAVSLGISNQAGQAMTVWLVDVPADRPVWTLRLAHGETARQTVAAGTYKTEIVFDDELDEVYEGSTLNLSPNSSGLLTIRPGVGGEGLRRKRGGSRR
jgi:hypothetical protein